MFEVGQVLLVADKVIFIREKFSQNKFFEMDKTERRTNFMKFYQEINQNIPIIKARLLCPSYYDVVFIGTGSSCVIAEDILSYWIMENE